VVFRNKVGRSRFGDGFWLTGVVETAKQFVLDLMNPNPYKRPSAREALLHPVRMACVRILLQRNPEPSV
jgi:hypothetical protein